MAPDLGHRLVDFFEEFQSACVWVKVIKELQLDPFPGRDLHPPRPQKPAPRHEIADSQGRRPILPARGPTIGSRQSPQTTLHCLFIQVLSDLNGIAFRVLKWLRVRHIFLRFFGLGKRVEASDQQWGHVKCGDQIGQIPVCADAPALASDDQLAGQILTPLMP